MEKITIQESKTSSATQFKSLLNKADILQRHYFFRQSLDFVCIYIINKYTYCFQYYETPFVFVICSFDIYTYTSWSWSYSSWIYNYICNECPSPLTLWVRIPLLTRCTRYSVMWYSLSVICGRSVVLSRYSRCLHQ